LPQSSIASFWFVYPEKYFLRRDWSVIVELVTEISGLVPKKSSPSEPAKENSRLPKIAPSITKLACPAVFRRAVPI